MGWETAEAGKNESKRLTISKPSSGHREFKLHVLNFKPQTEITATKYFYFQLSQRIELRNTKTILGYDNIFIEARCYCPDQKITGRFYLSTTNLVMFDGSGCRVIKKRRMMD